MPRRYGTEIRNSFSKGLITESTPLNFPKDAVTDAINVVFDRDGSVYRRYGIDYEDNVTKLTQSLQGVVHSFLWETVSQDGTVTFVVMQNGEDILFYELGTSSISDNKKSFSVDLTTYKADASFTTAEVAQERASFSSGNGYLFIAHKLCEPLYIEYDPSGDSITTTQITINIRDFEGMDDGLEVNERPTTLSKAHEYNLQNQGWTPDNVEMNGANRPPLAEWDTNRSDFPSNRDVWWTMRDANNEFLHTQADEQSPVEGNRPAPKGSMLLNAFNKERTVTYQSTSATDKPSNSAITGTSEVVETVSTSGIRPSQTAFYAGRVWWAGVQFSQYTGNLYFSQLIESTDDFGECYQVNDPTAETFSDLLSTDGGVVSIPEIGRITGLLVVGDNLLVFATNGIWAISGSDLSGFKADDYRIRKITELGVNGPYSFITARNTPYWWNKSGIYTLTQDGNSFEVQSISEQSIEEYYLETIPNEAIPYAKGAYHEIDNTITWIWRSTAPSATFTDNFKYDRTLVLDLNTGSIAIHSFDDTNIDITDIIAVEGTFDYQNSGVDDGTDRSIINKYFIYEDDTDLTFAEIRNKDYKDWYGYDTTGVDYTSYLLNGYSIKGQTDKNQQTHYITLTNKTESGSSYYVSGHWDYALNSNTNRVTTRQQGYKHSADTKYVDRRLKFRGRGTVVQFMIESDSNNPFHIAGWAVFDSTAETP